MPASGRLTDFCTRHAWLLAAIVLAATLSGVVVYRSPVIALDGITFVEMAVALDENAQQAFKTFDQHPGYPAMLLAVARAGEPLFETAGARSYIWAGRFVSAACGVLSVVLVWLLTRRIFDSPRVADVAAVVFAGLPLIRQNAADVLSDAPHLTFYLLAAWCIASGLGSGRIAWFAAGGAASGLAFWIRPEGMSVALVAAAMSLCWLVRPGETRRRRILACLVALTGAVVVVVAPYLLGAGKFTSKKDPLANHQKPATHQLPYVEVADSPPVPASPAVPAVVDKGSPTTADAMRSTTISRLHSAIAKYIEEIGYSFKYILLIPLACGHFAPARLRPHLPAYVLVWSLAIFHSVLLLWLHYSAGYMGHRHMIPLVALGMPFVASGSCWIVERICALLSCRRWHSLALAGAVATVLIAFLPRTLRPLNHVSRSVIEAAAWVDRHRASSSRVLANSLYVRFYADMPGDVLGIETPDIDSALARVNDQSGYDFVVLEVDTRRFQPPDGDLRNRGYWQVFRLDGGHQRSWHQVVVYRFEPKLVRAPSQAPMAADSPNTARQ